MNQKKVGVMLSYTSEAIKILTSLLYTPVMLRLLGQSEYGLYQLVHSVVSYLGLLSLGFTSSYVRYFSIAKKSGDENNVARLNGMFMTIFLIIAAIAALCGGVMVTNIRGIFGTGLTESEYSTARVLMILMVFNLSVSFPNSVFNCIISAHERFFFQRLLTVLQNLLNPFLTLPLLLIGYGSIGMVAVTTGLTLTKLALDIWYVFRKLNVRFEFKKFNLSLLKDIWAFTFFVFLNQIIDQLNWSVDRFLLGRMLGTSAVAVYGLGAQINTMYVQLSTTISSVFVPQINRIVVERNDNHELSVLFTRIGRIQFVLLSFVLSGFVFLGHPFMEMWGGEKIYGMSFYVAIILIAPATIPLIQNLGIEIQRAKNMHRARSVVYFCIAIANVLVSIPLIRRFGVVGAPIGTAIAIAGGNILFMNWYYAKRIGLEIREFWRNIFSFLPAFAVPVILGILIIRKVEIRGILSLGIWILIYSIVFCTSMWFLGLNASEKQLIKGIIRRMKHR